MRAGLQPHRARLLLLLFFHSPRPPLTPNLWQEGRVGAQGSSSLAV